MFAVIIIYESAELILLFSGVTIFFSLSDIFDTLPWSRDPHVRLVFYKVFIPDDQLSSVTNHSCL